MQAISIGDDHEVHRVQGGGWRVCNTCINICINIQDKAGSELVLRNSQTACLRLIPLGISETSPIYLGALAGENAGNLGYP